MGGFDFGSSSPPRGDGTLPGEIRIVSDWMIRTTPMVDSPAEINGGYCKQLAEIVSGRVHEPTKILRAWQGMGSRHFFIESGGKYYDAERPDGVDEIKDLPFFNGRAGYDVEPVSGQSNMSYSSGGSSFPSSSDSW